MALTMTAAPFPPVVSSPLCSAPQRDPSAPLRSRGSTRKHHQRGAGEGA